MNRRERRAAFANITRAEKDRVMRERQWAEWARYARAVMDAEADGHAWYRTVFIGDMFDQPIRDGR